MTLVRGRKSFVSKEVAKSRNWKSKAEHSTEVTALQDPHYENLPS